MKGCFILRVDLEWSVGDPLISSYELARTVTMPFRISYNEDDVVARYTGAHSVS